MFQGAPIPANWEAFLRSNANKDELFRYMSDCIHACETSRKVIICTNDETIVSTQNNMSDVEYLQPCSHEEADTRILLHVEHCARQGLRKVSLEIFPSVSDAFLGLSLQPVDVSSETIEGIERFIVVMYSRTCSASEVRKELFAHGSRTMEPNKPSKAALLQHVRRAA